MITAIVAVYERNIVISAIGATVLLVAILTIIAYTNCVDLTGMTGIMTAISLGIFVLVILGFFFGGGGLISGLLVLGFGVFLVYDTQLVLGKG